MGEREQYEDDVAYSNRDAPKWMRAGRLYPLRRFVVKKKRNGNDETKFRNLRAVRNKRREFSIVNGEKTFAPHWTSLRAVRNSNLYGNCW